ncbi:hypothetical protein [Vulcanisaeta souniana]|uniref:DNA-binding protein n=2 Tax=Vulcanisaeta souniana JCM 11219 TaxID=1293586 RepID=A0ABM8BPT1_9CREN|nr:hypothetical protein [Vulcanisaeta souniana]BDR93003.1 hypothetical protein Vsou_20960 [Vulcanisaeta souniana JCM 11219]
MTATENLMIDTRKVKILILQMLKDMILNAKGQLITFRPAKVAQDISIWTRKSPRSESVIVRNFLEELVELGLVKVIKRSARGKVYGIIRDTEFWLILEHNNVHEILTFIDGYKTTRRGNTSINMLRELANAQKINLAQTATNGGNKDISNNP